VRPLLVKRAILVTESCLRSFKSFTSAINFFVITVFLPLYLPSFWAAHIPWFCRSFRRMFSNSTMPERVVAISLLVDKSVKFGKSKATKVMFRLKQISWSFKNSSVFRLHRSIFVTIIKSFGCNSSCSNF
jgi:hypothetical protein